MLCPDVHPAPAIVAELLGDFRTVFRVRDALHAPAVQRDGARRRLAEVNVRLVATRIAVAHAEDPAGAAQLEVHQVARPPARRGPGRR